MSTELSGTPAKRPIDAMPYDRRTLADLTPEERSAIYLNSIRKMLVFFVALAAVGITVGVILGIVDIAAIHSAQSSTGGTGLGY